MKVYLYLIPKLKFKKIILSILKNQLCINVSLVDLEMPPLNSARALILEMRLTKHPNGCIAVSFIEGDSGQVANCGRAYLSTQLSLKESFMTIFLKSKIHPGYPIVVSPTAIEESASEQSSQQSLRKDMSDRVVKTGELLYKKVHGFIKECPSHLPVIIGGAHYYSKRLAHALADAYPDDLIVPIIYDRHLDCRSRDLSIGDHVSILRSNQQTTGKITKMHPAIDLNGMIFPPTYEVEINGDSHCCRYEDLELISDRIQHSGSWSKEMVDERSNQIMSPIWIGFQKTANTPITVENALRAGHKWFDKMDLNNPDVFAADIINYLTKLQNENPSKKIRVFSSTCGDTVNGWPSSAATEALGLDSQIIDTIDQKVFEKFEGMKHVAELDTQYLEDPEGEDRRQAKKCTEELFSHVTCLATAFNTRNSPERKRSIPERLAGNDPNALRKYQRALGEQQLTNLQRLREDTENEQQTAMVEEWIKQTEASLIDLESNGCLTNKIFAIFNRALNKFSSIFRRTRPEQVAPK